MYLAQYKSQRYPIPYRRGLGCACPQRPLGDIWTSVDNAVATAVDWASIPWNLISGGQLTQAQKLALLVQGQDQISAVANSPGAQINPSVQAVAQATAQQNIADLQTSQDAVLALPGPTNSDIYLSWLKQGLGAQPKKSFLDNYGPLLLAGGGVALALWLLKS